MSVFIANRFFSSTAPENMFKVVYLLYTIGEKIEKSKR